MVDLYEQLATLHRTRVDVAAKWLEVNHLLVPVEKPVLRPHTPEWFKAQEVRDPPQATISRMIIGLSGSAEVCSVCRDDPSCDYRLEEGQRPAGGVDTLRLCADCLVIRARMGEVFTLIPAGAQREEDDIR